MTAPGHHPCLHSRVAMAPAAAMLTFTYIVEWSWLLQQLVFVVECAPVVGRLGATPLPVLQVQSRPEHVKAGEGHETVVVDRLTTHTN